MAAVGMALGNMELSLTTGKKKYAEYQEEIEELIVKAGDITNRLYECMDKDAKAFKPLSEAYGLPKDTQEQLEHRNKVMENALLIILLDVILLVFLLMMSIPLPVCFLGALMFLSAFGNVSMKTMLVWVFSQSTGTVLLASPLFILAGTYMGGSCIA